MPLYDYSRLLLLLTALAAALIAGLFYAWSCSVIPGLSRLPDADYINAMQQLNRAIENPVFFASFMGALILLPCCTLVLYRQQGHWPGYLTAATLVYWIGVMGVTAAGNIPLNKALDAFSLHTATREAIAAQRALFELPWRRLHNIRTIAACISLVLVLLACLQPAQPLPTGNR